MRVVVWVDKITRVVDGAMVIIRPCLSLDSVVGTPLIAETTRAVSNVTAYDWK